jgi:hypothetical protein
MPNTEDGGLENSAEASKYVNSAERMQQKREADLKERRVSSSKFLFTLVL